MSKPLTKIEETLSIAYATAVIGIAGHSLTIISEDYGTDISIRRIDNFNNMIIDLGPIFECQLKSTVNWQEEKEHIVYDMEAAAFNRLIYQHQNASSPVILVLLCLPKNEIEWLAINIDELKLRKCCFYKIMDDDFTTNSDSIRIRIPKKNVFNPENVSKLVSEVGKL